MSTDQSDYPDEDVQPEELLDKAWPPLLKPRLIRFNRGNVEVWGDCGTSPVILMRAESPEDAVAIMTQMIGGKSRIGMAFRAGIAIGKASAAMRPGRTTE